METKKKCLLASCLVIFVFYSSICFADTETSPMTILKQRFDEIVTTLKSAAFKNKTKKEQQDEMYEKINSSFDFKIVSMLALGRNWKRFSKDQKDDFAQLFSRLVTNVYLIKIRGKNLDGIKIDYKKAVNLKSKSRRSDVHTIFHNSDGVETPVVYRMIQDKSKNWRIYDILIEGVSLIANYRDTYKQQMNVSPEVIIKELKAKVEK